MFLLIFCLCLGGCSTPEYFIYEDEYFIYSYSVNSFDKDEDKYIYIY